MWSVSLRSRDVVEANVAEPRPPTGPPNFMWSGMSYEPGPGTLSRPMLSACTNLPRGLRAFAGRELGLTKEASGQEAWWFRCLEVSRRGLYTRRALFALGSASVGSLCSCAPSNLYSGENRGTVSAWHQCPHAVSVLRCEHHAVGRRVHQHQAARHHKRRVAQTKIAMSNFGCVCRPRSSCPRSIVRVAFVACQTATCAFPTQAVIS